MRIRYLYLSSVAFFILGATHIFAGPLKDTYWLQERGELTKFEIARDEVHSGRVPRRVSPRTSADDLRRVASAEAAELVLYPEGAARVPANRRLLTKHLAVRLAPGTDPARLTAAGVKVLKSISRDRAWWLVESNSEPGSAVEAADLLKNLPGVTAVEPQLAKQQQKRATIPNDPLFARQWHLRNSGQNGGEPDIDINVVNTWDSFRGNGIVIGIVDDGLDRSHPDLAPNYNAALSFDFNFNDNDPEPPSFRGDDHGTACAGVAAARGLNGVGVAGAAFNASLAGLRLISRPTRDADEAEAFAFQSQAIHIKSNSWGPTDNGKILDGPGSLTLQSFQDAVTTGRGGRGTILVWAGGNGLEEGDDSNFDGYANAPETIAVGAVDNDGDVAFYSETGANLVVVAPSGGGTLDICTTDRVGADGFNDGGSFSDDVDDPDYTGGFGGTSSACPLVAGCVALMLQANPDLGWRDVQEILMRTAAMVRPFDPDWATNAGGFHFNHKFGGGMVDAGAAVALAEGWTNLGSRTSAAKEEAFRKRFIADGNAIGIEQVFTFSEAIRVEHVCVTVDIRHNTRGQIEVELISPSGMRSLLAPARSRDRNNNFKKWRFMSVRHWGESSEGTWRVVVRDTKRKRVGTLRSLKVELFGTAES